jgi:subtilisin family serine protease
MKNIPLTRFLLCSLFVIGCQRNEVTEVFPESQSSLSQKCAETVIPNEYLIRYKNGVTEIVTAQSQNEFIEDFLKPRLQDVDHVEFHKFIYLDANLRPFFMHQASNSAPQSWGQDRIEVGYVHSLGYRGQDIRVAIIDSAVDVFHPALQDKIQQNLTEASGLPNKDDDGNGLIDDVWGWNFYEDKAIDSSTLFHAHGTHVVGIIAGSTNEWTGVAPQAKIIPVSFMSNDGYGSVAAAVNSIRYAKSRGAQIINASWGGPLCSKILEEEIKAVTDSGILFVAASGNDGVDLDWQPQYPAAFNFDLQLTVAASRPSDYLAGFSNTSYHLVHLAAPGDSIWSTLPNGQFGYLSGTSMAAPFVSGAAAVLMSARPDFTPHLIKKALLKGVDVRSYRVQSSGRLNLKRSLEILLTW